MFRVARGKLKEADRSPPMGRFHLFKVAMFHTAQAQLSGDDIRLHRAQDLKQLVLLSLSHLEFVQ